MYVFCIYLRANSDLYYLQHRLIDFYKRNEKCLQRGTNRVFKYSSLLFVFKRLINVCFVIMDSVECSWLYVMLQNNLMSVPCILDVVEMKNNMH
jgi:hypothetical protein